MTIAVDSTPCQSETIWKLISEGRVYYNPGKPVLVHHHTTYLYLFPSDIHPRNAKHLDEIIASALHYHGSIKDIEVLNALSHTPTWNQGNYAVLGLYLYLADEASRCPNGSGKTFFQACREAGLTQKSYEVTDTEDMRDKLANALRLLGLYDNRPDIQQLVNDWHDHGTFSVQGVRHFHKNNQLGGAYVELAERINLVDRQPCLQISDMVSYAMANKDNVSEADQQEAYDHTTSLLNKPQRLKQIVAKGDKMRMDRLRAKARAAFSAESVTTLSEEGREIAHELLSGLPEHVLNIIYDSGRSIAYASEGNVSNLYPEENLPGRTEEECEISRGSKGLALSRFNITLVSDGYKARNYEPEKKLVNVRQTIIHETLHNAFWDETTTSDKAMMAEIKQLKKDAIKVCKTLAEKTGEYPDLNERSYTIDSQPLLKIFSHYLKGYTYDGGANYPVKKTAKIRKEIYRNIKAWPEEVLANVYSLSHTEFKFAHWPPELKEIAERTTSLMEQIAERIHERKIAEKAPELQR